MAGTKGVIRYDDLFFNLIEPGPPEPFLRLDPQGKVVFVDSVQSTEDFLTIATPLNGRVYKYNLSPLQGDYIFNSASVLTADNVIVFPAAVAGRFIRLVQSNYYDAKWYGNADSWFAGIADANTKVKVQTRFRGLKVLIEVAGVVGEYWWKAGTADVDLVSTSVTGDGSETKIEPGPNITITGNGTIGNPYKISATFSSNVVTPTVLAPGTIIQFIVGGGGVGWPADGATTYTNAQLPSTVQVFRNGFPQNLGDPGNGNSYYTKPPSGAGSTTITFSPALVGGELIQIVC
jgi:hypothetical protein